MKALGNPCLHQMLSQVLENVPVFKDSKLESWMFFIHEYRLRTDIILGSFTPWDIDEYEIEINTARCSDIYEVWTTIAHELIHALIFSKFGDADERYIRHGVEFIRLCEKVSPYMGNRRIL